MKKTLLFTCFLIYFFINDIRLNAQPYQKFLAGTNEWDIYFANIVVAHPNEPESVSPLGSGPVFASYDSVIGSYTYKRTYTRTEDPLIPTNKPCFVREDTITKQVFILSADSSNERIMYDFSLVTGDSIYLEYRYENSFIHKLKSGWYFVDSTGLINTISGVRNTWYLSNPFNNSQFPNLPQVTWIEGVGSTISPLYLDEEIEDTWFLFHPYAQYAISLTCVFQDGSPIFHDSAWAAIYALGGLFGDSCIFMLSGIHENDGLDHSLKLKPNPMISTSVISLNHQGATGIFTYRICMFDVAGRMIDNYSLNGNELTNGFEWKPVHISPGCVFVTVYSDNRLVAAGKLMVE